MSLRPDERLALSLAEAVFVSGVSEPVLRRAEKAGLLRFRYPSRRAVIRVADLDAYLDNLPLDPPDSE